MVTAPLLSYKGEGSALRNVPMRQPRPCGKEAGVESVLLSSTFAFDFGKLVAKVSFFFQLHHKMPNFLSLFDFYLLLLQSKLKNN